ncbi:MAG: hypothetical protein M1838_000629 [Thelocarpon superellum]|nr:MAG: hypothetical protein M1838_000629 [Thelocarpon superellum]
MAQDSYRSPLTEPPPHASPFDPRVPLPSSFPPNESTIPEHRHGPDSVPQLAGDGPDLSRYASAPQSGGITNPSYLPDPRAPAPAAARAPPAASSQVPPASVRPGTQPINDALSSALNRGETAEFSPELVAQVAEQVAQEVLRKLNIAKANAPSPVPSPSIPSSTAPPRSTDQPAAPPLSGQPAPEESCQESYQSPSSHPRPNYVFYGGPRDAPVASDSSKPDSSPPTSKEVPRPDPPPVRVAEAAQTSRPKVTRAPTDEETPLDRTWGQLFAEDGTSTPRLRQFLRGLANHLIEDFEPKNSIVVTPVKMAKYYDVCKLRSEFWPWRLLFMEMSSSKLSRIYQELECQHHFIQERNDCKPSIPGLTAAGFARWMTLLIRARPNDEVERLQKAILQMPISNADDQKERFPKEVSRHLFPKIPDRRMREKIERAFPMREGSSPGKAFDGDYPRADSTYNASGAGQIERERAPYSNVSTDSVDTPSQASGSSKTERERPSPDAVSDGPSPPGSLERERKPYSAQPGGGKNYEGDAKSTTIPAMHNNLSTGRPRTQSTSGRPREYLPTRDFPPTHIIPPPDGPRHGRTSSSVGNPPAPPRQRRSPSVTKGSGPSSRPEPESMPYPETFSGVDTGVDNRRYPRPPDVNKSDWPPYGQSPTRRYPGNPPANPEWDGYERPADPNAPKRGYEEDYYRAGGRPTGNGYESNPPYPPPYH